MCAEPRDFALRKGNPKVGVEHFHCIAHVNHLACLILLGNDFEATRTSLNSALLSRRHRFDLTQPAARLGAIILSSSQMATVCLVQVVRS